MITLSGKSVVFKVAAGAWGFAGNGYPEILWSPRSLGALLKLPLSEWPAAIGLWCALALEWLLLMVGVLDAKRFAFTTKTLTMKPLKGNPLHAWIRRIDKGFVNAVGLANPGIDWWILEQLPDLRRRGIRPIVSIAPNTPEEARGMVERLCVYREDILAIEVNPGCPNTPEGKRMFEDPIAVVEIARAAWEARGRGETSLLLKLSVAHAWRAVIVGAEGYVDGFELINAVPWVHGRPLAESPLAQWGGGGISGPRIFATLMRVMTEARPLTEKPLIACGGITCREEVESALWGLHADAVSIGTGFLLRPFHLAWLSRRWTERTTVI